MKKCKIYSTAQNKEADAVIVDSCVLLPAPRRDDITPAHISDGQCYYPPLYAATFAKGMNFNLMPFSTKCEWGEYGDDKVRNWFAYYSGDCFSVKWGYCDTKTGRICIPPEMEYCEDFNKYGTAIFGGLADKENSIRDGVYSGIMDTKGNIVDGGYVGIKESYHGVFFIYQTADGWGTVDSEGTRLIEPLHYNISWDGMGGFTIVDKTRDGVITYGIMNGECHDLVTKGLTQEPTTVYDFPAGKRRENLSWDEYFHRERFRLTQRGDTYGLVRDVLEDPHEPLYTYTEEILEPIYRYEDIPNAAYEAWIDAEIHYYAIVMSKTPRKLQGRVGDGWDIVPKDIRNAVREYMKASGMEQPETAQDLD